MKKCPECGCKQFYVTAHVTEDWIVDENGYFLESISGDTEVVHRPDDDDLWCCIKCGYETAGREFNVKEEV